MTIGVVHAEPFNTLTPSITSTGPGHSLIVVVNSFGASGAPSIDGVTLGGVALTQAVSKINSLSGWQSSWIYYKSGIASDQTAVVVSGSNLVVDSSDGGVDILELDCPIILDKTNSNSGADTGMSTGPTGTLSSLEEIAIGAFSGGSPTDTAGWTDVAASAWRLTSYKNVSATTSLNQTADNDGTFWAGAIATFRRGASQNNAGAFMGLIV